MTQVSYRSNQPYFSLIIPSYNEGRRLEKTIGRAMRFLEGLGKKYELIVVDDGSRDSSSKIIKKLQKQFKKLKVIIHKRNRGKGAAVRSGIKVARGKYIAFTDADLATPPEELLRAWEMLERGEKMVIASRKMADSSVRVHQPWVREVLGKVFTSLSNLLLGLNVTDVTCGMKAWERQTAKKLWSRQKLDDWSFDAEILFLARKYQIPIRELPVAWSDQPSTKVKLLNDSLKSLWGLGWIKINDLLGRYG